MNEDFRLLASYYMSLVEGDTHQIEYAFALMRAYRFIDENDEIICEDNISTITYNINIK